MEKSVRFGSNWIAISLALGIVLMILLGCGAASEADRVVEQVVVERVASEAEEASYPAPAMPQGTAAPVAFEEPAAESGEAVERLIIRTGQIAIVVEDTRAARATVEALVAEMAPEGAFVVSGDEYGGSGGQQPHISMGIRVPAAHFERTMDRLAEMAVEVSNRSESAQDVTEEYVDLEARLESLEAARQRLLEIMEESRSTKDLLEAEQQLTQREAEIESIKGRMKYLSQSAQLSSIWIELEPYILSQPVDDAWRPAETIRRAWQALLNGLRGFADFALFFAIAVLPWLIVIGLVLWAIVWLVRRRVRARGRESEAKAQAPDRD